MISVISLVKEVHAVYNPNIWKKAPLNWEPCNIYEVTFLELHTARKNEEVELMYDFWDNIWWRRDLNETRELGL